MASGLQVSFRGRRRLGKIELRVSSLEPIRLYRPQFRLAGRKDETDRWGIILAERLRMYEKLRGEAEQAGAPAGHDDFYKSYALFVSLVQQKIMGGARFAAVKPA